MNNKKILGLFVGALSLFAFGCGSTPSGNADGTGVNTTVLNPANMPPGLSGSPLPMNGSPIPGIPMNAQPLPKGTTPTPGIPSPEELKRGPKKGTTPTPGIPDPESIRKSMGRPSANANANKPAANVPMMRSTNRPSQ
jgi:hypothetical protein